MSDVAGPSKSALKAMLVNLDSDDGMPPLQSGSLSPQADAVRSGMIDIHVVDGMFGHLTLFSF